MTDKTAVMGFVNGHRNGHKRRGMIRVEQGHAGAAALRGVFSEDRYKWVEVGRVVSHAVRDREAPGSNPGPRPLRPPWRGQSETSWRPPGGPACWSSVGRPRGWATYLYSGRLGWWKGYMFTGRSFVCRAAHANAPRWVSGPPRTAAASLLKELICPAPGQ